MDGIIIFICGFFVGCISYFLYAWKKLHNTIVSYDKDFQYWKWNIKK